jgi:SOS response regulatory protein OraA/RecX
MFRELKLVREMRAGRAAALGGVQRGWRTTAELRSRLEKPPA